MRWKKYAAAGLSLAFLVGCTATAEVTTQPPPPKPVPAPPPPKPVAKPKLEYITVSERIQFETASAVLLTQSTIVLNNDVVKVLKDNPQITLIEIGGHTDSRGLKDDNLLLSQQRAESVKAYLMTQGINGTRMRAMGYGDRVPVAPNATDAGRLQNRRVEFRIIEQGQ